MKKINDNHEPVRLTAALKLRLKKEIKRIYKNKELTEYIERHLSLIPVKDKIAALYYFKKLVLQTYRSPDSDHYAAFEDEYEEEMSEIRAEQQFYEPVRWIDAEIDYQTNMGERLTGDDVTGRLDIMQEAKKRLSKDWLTKEEVMELFGISRSTLNRRIADGMPAHKSGKAVYFYLEEINQWMRREAA